MNPRRLYAPVVLGTLAVGGVAFLAASRTWAAVDVAAEGLPPDEVTVSGSSAQPLVSALAIVVVTAALAILAASRRVRQGVGVLTAVVGLVGALVVANSQDALTSAVRDAVEASPAFTGDRVPEPALWSAWSVLTLLAFVVTTALGALTVRLAPAWPTMSSRYDAPGARAAVKAPTSDADIWKALDEGHDPTQ